MEGKTLSEKIIGEHCGKEVRAGEVVIVNVDLSYARMAHALLRYAE